MAFITDLAKLHTLAVQRSRRTNKRQKITVCPACSDAGHPLHLVISPTLTPAPDSRRSEEVKRWRDLGFVLNDDGSISPLTPRVVTLPDGVMVSVIPQSRITIQPPWSLRDLTAVEEGGVTWMVPEERVVSPAATKRSRVKHKKGCSGRLKTRMSGMSCDCGARMDCL